MTNQFDLTTTRDDGLTHVEYISQLTNEGNQDYYKGYEYIYDLIKDSPSVDDNTKTWFERAIEINRNDPDSAANNYIRLVTAAGLAWEGGAENNLQDISNDIGRDVIKNIILGGGIFSMVRVCLVVIVSTAFAGLFTGTNILNSIQIYLEKAKSRSNLFLATNIIGIASAAFGCTQTIAILLTEELVKDNYQENQLDNYQRAVDLENSVVVLSPLIPWNIAGLVPATILMTDSGFIPFAFYLYFVPLFNYFDLKIKERASNS